MGKVAEQQGTGCYALAQHVHVAECGRHVVLMDLRGNRYFAVDPAEQLAGWVRDWPAAPSAAPRRAGAQAPPLLKRMLKQGMLVADRRHGRAPPPPLPLPQRTLLEADFDTVPEAHAGALARMLRAWLTARAALAFRPIHAIVAGVRARKAGAPREMTEEELSALISTFRHLRPLFYSARGQCLLDSLTLLHYLAAYGAFPDWAFGVRTAPFHAHCWLQQGEVLFNDIPDRVRQYSVILVV